MSVINTNLSSSYCADWQLWEAIREILQNAIDQEVVDPLNAMDYSYDEVNNKLTISNKHSSLDRSTILLGESSKKGDDKTIGQHGEGYKISMLVLTRLGKPVVIKNYKNSELWTPFFEADKQYGNKEVFKIKIKKHIFTSVPDSHLTFEISDISGSEWECLKPFFLRFSGVTESFKCNDGEVLFDKEYRGKIFVNGLFVEEITEEEYAFGYNFAPHKINLDRDRKRIQSFELKWQCASLLSQWEKSTGIESTRTLKRLLSENYAEVESLEHQYCSFDKENISDLFVADLIKEHGENAYPVTSQKERELIERNFKGVKAVSVSKNESQFLSKSPRYSSIQNFVKDKNIIFVKTTMAALLADFTLKHRKRMSYDMGNDFDKLVDSIEKFENSNNTSPSDNSDYNVGVNDSMEHANLELSEEINY